LCKASFGSWTTAVKAETAAAATQVKAVTAERVVIVPQAKVAMEAAEVTDRMVEARAEKEAKGPAVAGTVDATDQPSSEKGGNNEQKIGQWRLDWGLYFIDSLASPSSRRETFCACTC
jgi:hypothetical protein